MAGAFRPERVGNYPLVEFGNPASSAIWDVFTADGTATSADYDSPLPVYLEGSTQPENYSTRTFGWNNSVTLNAGEAFGVGVMLRGELAGVDGMNFLYRLHAAVTALVANSEVRVRPFCGRISTESPAAGGGQSVPLPFYLPGTGYVSLSSVTEAACDISFLSVGFNWWAYPVVAGLAFINPGASNRIISNVRGSISFVRYTEELEYFDPKG